MTHPILASARSSYGGRGYRIPGRVNEHGKPVTYPSVTTVLKQVNKPALMQWAADTTAAYAIANMNTLLTQSDEVAWRYLRFYWNREADLDQPLRTHHLGVRDDAAELGTNIHEHIEADLVGSLLYPPILSVEVEQMLTAWEDWAGQHEIVSHHQEFTIVHDEAQYAGTADGDWSILCLHDHPCLGSPGPHRVLIDLKTSRYTWPEHGMQLAALLEAPIAMVQVPEGTPGAQRAEKTEGGMKVVSWWLERERPRYKRAALLHIRPRDLTPKGDRIEAFCELVDMTEDLDLYYQGFKGALALCHSARQRKTRADRRALAGL